MLSGGRMKSAEQGWLCQGFAAAVTLPELPMLLPP
jgi:hypothetical protein